MISFQIRLSFLKIHLMMHIYFEKINLQNLVNFNFIDKNFMKSKIFINLIIKNIFNLLILGTFSGYFVLF